MVPEVVHVLPGSSMEIYLHVVLQFIDGEF